MLATSLQYLKSLSKISVSLLSLTVVMGSCSFAADLWIEPGSTLTHLVFGMAYSPHTRHPIALSSMTVQTAFTDKKSTQSLVWGMNPANPTEGYGPPVSSVVYGMVPNGYKPLHSMVPLEIGESYVVTILGNQGHHAAIKFVVRPNGIVERE